MMNSNELFYGDQEPVFVVDTAAYPIPRGRVPSPYADPLDKYISRPSSAGYYREPIPRSRYPDYGGRHGDRYSRSDYYRSASPPRYSDHGVYGDSYTSGAYYSPTTALGHTNPYDDTYYDSRPNEYYDYRRPSTVVLKVPICCESCSEEARNALFEVRGVRSVYCDVRKEMITVTGTAAPADILQVLRKLHKKSRFWGDNDY